MARQALPLTRRTRGATIDAVGRVAVAACALVASACAGTSSEPSPPIATAGTAPATVDPPVPSEGEVAEVVVVHPVLRTTIGSCEDFGVGVRLEARRCHTVGAPLDLGDWVAAAEPVDDPDAGWSVDITLVDTAVPATVAAFEVAVAAGTDRFLVVADGRGLLEFTLGDLALDPDLDSDPAAATLTLGPDLSAREAAVVAAVLAGRPWPDLDRRPAAVGEVWTTALAVHVCGAWLAAPPDVAASDGLSIEDGLVVLRPTAAADADRPVALGRLLDAQGWLATDDHVVLWDGVDVRTGDTCPDGREATVRWSVDGDDRTGDPSDVRLGHRQVIVLSFDPADEVPVDEPPVSATLPIPQLTADDGR